MEYVSNDDFSKLEEISLEKKGQCSSVSNDASEDLSGMPSNGDVGKGKAKEEKKSSKRKKKKNKSISNWAVFSIFGNGVVRPLSFVVGTLLGVYLLKGFISKEKMMESFNNAASEVISEDVKQVPGVVENIEGNAVGIAKGMFEVLKSLFFGG